MHLQEAPRWAILQGQMPAVHLLCTTRPILSSTWSSHCQIGLTCINTLHPQFHMRLILQGYEEVHVPAPKHQPFPKPKRLIEIADQPPVHSEPQASYVQGYEEVHVPAPKHKPFAKDERLIEIGELPAWAQPAFPKMKSLNRIQSNVYETAFNSADNVLMCAPTGAGKTNVAMLTMLHEVSLLYSSCCEAQQKFGVAQQTGKLLSVI